MIPKRSTFHQLLQDFLFETNRGNANKAFEQNWTNLLKVNSFSVVVIWTIFHASGLSN